MIRKYEETDCEAVIDAWFAASLVATPFLSEAFLARERENIRTTWLPRAETWVYEENEVVVGFLSLVGNEVGAIFVHPSRQGFGIGRALMDHAASMRDELYLDVFEENQSGRGFYERYGFQYDSEHLHEETGHTQLRLLYRPTKSP